MSFNKATTDRVAYLSGAPRVSTRPDAEDGGPRAHVLGTIEGFRQLDWAVDTFIVGDQVPRSWVTGGSYARKQGGVIKKALVDGIRLGMRVRNNARARRAVPAHPDFVYERFACMQALGAGFKRAGVPWVLETNALVFKEFKLDSSAVLFSRLARHLELSAYRQCDALVCVSQKLKELILSEVEIPASKVIVLPNGVDTNVFHPLVSQQEADNSALNIGFVGTFVAWQALDLLLEAVHDARQAGMDVRLILVGGGPEEENLADLANRLGIQQHVSFKGRLPRDDVVEAIAGFDVGYSGHLPTKAGTMYMSPLKLYEYMAMGKPVVVSRNADSEQLITQDETGFFFTADDQESLKNAIHRAVAHKAALADMGSRARTVIERHHSWQKRVETLIEQLAPLLGTATKPSKTVSARE